MGERAREFFEALPAHAGRTAGMRASYVFVVNGSGTWTVKVVDGRVDVSEGDYNIDVDAVEAVINRRSRILLPVHLYGQLADMRALAAVARRHGLDIVEDACQAHGGARAGLGCARLSSGAAFSFYPSKNLGAMGDAGAFVCDDDALTNRHGLLFLAHQVVKLGELR